MAQEFIENALKFINEISTSKFLEELWKVLNLANLSITKYEPWNLMKNGETDKACALVGLCANLLARVAMLLSPVMPHACDKIASALGFEISPIFYTRLIKNGEILDFISRQSEPLFAKVENELLDTPPKISSEISKTTTQNEPEISQIKIDDFKKSLIKVGTILECENIAGSEKLLKFKIDLGEDAPRQIISGIAKFYTPSELVGKQVCVLANLKPAKIFGHISEGMILSAEDGKLTLLSTLSSVKNGAIVG